VSGTAGTVADQSPPSAHARINGVRIAYEVAGSSGPPLVLIHGSWGSHHSWDPVVPALAEHARVVTYDRRGHSDSERPPGQGHFNEDVDDLAALLVHLRMAPAWVGGNSSGAVITLKLAAARPELVRGIVAHEPPLLSLRDEESRAAAVGEEISLAQVRRRLEDGDLEGGAEQFVEEVALGPGGWASLPAATRETMVRNASTYLDELDDPEWQTIDEAGLARFGGPVLLTSGDQSPAWFRPILDRLADLLPHAQRHVYRGAGHVPYATHPQDYVAAVLGFISETRGATP
jgi:pimeloyl-ACP methyl ester carboxylesterase